MSSIFIDNAGQWLIVLAVLIFGVYTLVIIKDEVVTFKEQSSPLRLGNIEIDIADWWSLVNKDQTKSLFHYERADTRYEWFAKLEYIETGYFEKIQDIFDRYLEKQKVSFDPDVVITTIPSHIFLNKETASQVIEALRVEGKATQDQMKRIYWDVYLFRVGDEENYYIFESWSSVLNGMLEGPFFEEAVSNLKVVSEKTLGKS